MRVIIMPVGMLGTNCYILQTDQNHCIIIDPGAQSEKIIGQIEDLGLKPVYLLLTHGHFDHVGGAKKLMEHFPEMKLYIGEKDLPALIDPQISSGVLHGFEPEIYLFEPEMVNTLSEGDQITIDELELEVLETPGHTLGGVTYLCTEWKLLFTGDTLFRENVGRTDLYGGSYPALKESLKKLAALPGDYEVYPGHGEASAMGYERLRNPYIVR